jgi:hypothetical protein
MDGALASDLTVTWLGALGTALYLRFLARTESMRDVRPAAYLFGVLTVLLLVRGFFWIHGGPWLGRLVFAAATLLPITMTVFTEHLLRRHHPRWLKVLALGVSVVFGVLNLFADLASDTRLLLFFLAGLAATIVCNAWYLLRSSGDDLARNELRLVRMVVVAACVATLLAVTDFRAEIPQIPVRLGALGPLFLAGVLLGQSDDAGLARTALLQPLAAVACAAALAAAFALSTQGIGAGFLPAALAGLPIACSWILLTVIVVRIRALSAASPGNRFLHWLLEARLDTAPGFVDSLRGLSQTGEHVVLGEAELAGYSLDLLFGAEGTRTGALALSEARARVRARDPAQLDAAEQLIDLLEKHEMTHALPISRQPPLVVLLNLPPGADAASGELRAAVIQRLGRRLAEAAA